MESSLTRGSDHTGSPSILHIHKVLFLSGMGEGKTIQKYPHWIQPVSNLNSSLPMDQHIPTHKVTKRYGLFKEGSSKEMQAFSYGFSFFSLSDFSYRCSGMLMRCSQCYFGLFRTLQMKWSSRLWKSLLR